MKILKKPLLILFSFAILLHFTLISSTDLTAQTTGVPNTDDVEDTTPVNEPVCKTIKQSNKNAKLDKTYPNQKCVTCRWRVIGLVTLVKAGQYDVKYEYKEASAYATVQTCKSSDNPTDECVLVGLSGGRCPADEVFDPTTYTGPIDTGTGTGTGTDTGTGTGTGN